MSIQALPRVTFEQYLEVECEREFRSEFIDGQVFAMVGGSRTHGWIQGNSLAELHGQLKNSPCGVQGSDTLVYIPRYNLAVYPDVVVTCGPDKLSDQRNGNICDATMIIEVLSPSTQSYDRGDKFRYYRSLPSFSEYLLLAQNEMLAEHYVRQANGAWLPIEYTGPDDRIELKSIGCVLLLKDLYARVEFETKPA